MYKRDLFHALMNFEKMDTVLHLEYGLLDETYEKWRSQGMSYNKSDLWTYPEPNQAFFELGVDQFLCIRPETYFYPNFECKIIEQDDCNRTVINERGVLLKEKLDHSSMPQFIEYPIKNKEDYYKYRERLTSDFTSRYRKDWAEYSKKIRDQRHTVTCCHMDGFFGYPRELMGLENTLFTYYDDPHFMKELIDDRLDFYMGLYEKLIIDIKPDFAFIWEDMCYRNGPLISPKLFEEFMMPAYIKLIDYLKNMGIKNICVDSDGQINKLIPLWISAGVTALQPFEVKSGMDVIKIAEQYPNLQIWGGIDKHVIAKGSDNLRDELERVVPFMIKRSGYVLTLDHWVPPEMDYKCFIEYADTINNKFIKH